MPALEAGIRQKITGITSATPVADSTIMLRSRVGGSVLMASTGTAPVTGAKLQVSNSPPADLRAGTGIWADYDVNKTVSTMVVTASGDGGELTAVRLVVTDGTWTLQVRQR